MGLLRSKSAAALCAMALGGCAAPEQSQGDSVALSVAALESLTWTDGSLRLSAEVEVDPPTCVDNSVVLTMYGNITTNALVDSVVLVTNIDSEEQPPDVVLVTSADFAVIGRRYMASFGADIAVPDGAHDASLCFARSDLQGRSEIVACLDVLSYDMSCAAPPPPSDTTAPTITASHSPAANAAGWNNSDVTVSFACADDVGIASCSAPVLVSTEGAAQTVSGQAVDLAGNSASISASVSLDKTAPTISFSGTGDYFVDEQVDVSCSATDALSGVAASSCAGAAGPAYTFDLGTHVVSASAIDHAGNAAGAESSFRVVATPDSMCNLIHEWLSHDQKARKMCLDLAAAATTYGVQGFCGDVLRKFEVDLRGAKNHMSPEHADMLRSLANAWLPKTGC